MGPTLAPCVKSFAQTGVQPCHAARECSCWCASRRSPRRSWCRQARHAFTTWRVTRRSRSATSPIPPHTHGLSVLASLDNLVSVNSALEVDLLGQVNVETIGGRQISGVGRALDFARGAAASRNGRHLVTLASITASGRSRIATRLSRETPVAYTRHDLGIVVTEHGSADLRGLSTNEPAKAPVAVRDRRSVRAGEPEPRVGGDSERTARPVARRA